ncbi:MAG: ribosome recycling factor [Christensenellaceae bacterium]|jgi:ribosome recycling factor|nr:ribosome recycling factor [Christensenellaceae bacterium]
MEYFDDAISTAIDTFEGKLDDSVNFALGEFSNIRAGRVSPAVVENITVEYYGTPTRLRDLATITNEDSRTILINPWDVAVRPEVTKALGAANIGANPIDNGQYIRMIFPALTEERRKEFVKHVRVLAENGRVAMRNERRDAMDKVRKIAKDIKLGEDELKTIETNIQKMLNDYIANLDNFLQKKEAEIMTV